ncbi:MULTISPECIES: hypothetical protein [unclassified Streptomyces]|uniref:hypothetical protein n=1 Tax=unclassified Streptomyces TaxID=2593676 RepID=UPI000F6FE904|nr:MULTISPECIES: hypothetical protein [unclassified Streptomyces]AZM91569.1 hypothetical protein D1J60_26370 [Streptomyces sp. W1SF4]RSS48508.1 hypothetical protein EF912_25145 [Streptomyces sp. WAC07061]
MSTNSMRRTTLAAAGLAVAGTLVLTGCKDGIEETPAAPAAPSAAASAGSSAQPVSPAAPSSSAGGYDGSASASPAPGGAAAGGAVAKSGQSFKIGEAATVPFSYGSNKGGQLAITVTGIDAGNPSDLASLNIADKVKGKTPFYIRYTVKNTGNTDLSFASVGHMKGLLDGGSESDVVLIAGKFEKCPSESLPKGFTNGQSQNSCAVALAPTGTKVSGALYWGDPYNNLASPPQKGLTWK